MLNSRIVSIVIALAVALSLATAGSASANQNSQTSAVAIRSVFNVWRAAGSITCFGGPIVGVWVQAAAGSGWAVWNADNDPSSGTYYRALPRFEWYRIAVGCGGSPASWATTNWSWYIADAYPLLPDLWCNYYGPYCATPFDFHG